MADLAKKLKESSIATRVKWHWFTRTRKVGDYIKTLMVESIANGEGKPDEDSYTASAKLFNTRMGCFKAIGKLKNMTSKWWEDHTLPFVEAGIRLLPKDDLDSFNYSMKTFTEHLEQLAKEVQWERSAIINDAKQRLKGGFDASHYPDDLSTLFGLEWSFPSIEPPDYLLKMNPAIYQQEAAKAKAALEEAVRMAEQAFLTQFADLVTNLHERLTPSPDGTKKVFHASTVDNITDFIQRFQKLHIGGSDQLEKLVKDAKGLLAGVNPNDIRNAPALQKEIAAGMGAIQEKLGALTTIKPRRKITPKVKEPV